jgi:hypothetical protein
MSPFRYILRRGGVEHPVGYSLLLLAASMIICMLAAVTISVHASERAIRKSEIQQCESVQSDVNAYLETPPTTEAGKNQLRTKERLLEKWGCPHIIEEKPHD